MNGLHVDVRARAVEIRLRRIETLAILEEVEERKDER